MSATDTKLRILDAAEATFAEHGVEAASLRAITAAAEVNLAAVHYHYGSKEALFHAVLLRRIAPINAERLRLLDEAEAKAGPEGPELETVIRAFLAPTFVMAESLRGAGKTVMRFMALLHTDPSLQPSAEFFEAFRELQLRFGKAIMRAVPHLDRCDAAWRTFFMLGVMAFTMMDRGKLHFLSQGSCRIDDAEATLTEMVTFIAGGMRAPSATPAGKERI